MARVAVTHKRELRKLVVQLGKERCVILKAPEHADAQADSAKHFGLEYRGATLCAAVGAVLENRRVRRSRTGRATKCVRRRGTAVPSATQN